MGRTASRAQMNDMNYVTPAARAMRQTLISVQGCTVLKMENRG